MSEKSKLPFAVLEAIEALPDVVVDATSFAELTTLHVGGTPLATVRCASRDAVCAVVALLDDATVPLLIVGGGSNLLINDGEVPLVAVVLECDEVDLHLGTGMLVAEAGAVWDEVVDMAVVSGLGGIECLSGIPGSAGATPVQNVGAYGAEIADVLTRVELLDRETHERAWVEASSLELAYRYSNLKFTSRAVVLAIELQLRTDGLSTPLRFGELARVLGIDAPRGGEEIRWPIAEVREAVLGLRRGKGMVYDEADNDTWSAGSFFTNPIVDAEVGEKVRGIVAGRLGAEEAAKMPCFPAGEGKVKLSAAWLIDRAGYAKGYPGHGRATLSTKHTLALTNRGEASADDLVALARDIRGGVASAFGVTLEPEPVWVGLSIDEPAQS